MPDPNTRSRNVTVPPRLGYATESFVYEYVVSSATTPASANASGVPPCASCTARPRTAKIPPPTIPPTPIATTAQNPILPLAALPTSRAPPERVPPPIVTLRWNARHKPVGNGWELGATPSA